MTCSSESGPRLSSMRIVVSPRRAPISTTFFAPDASITGAMATSQSGNIRVLFVFVAKRVAPAHGPPADSGKRYQRAPQPLPARFRPASDRPDRPVDAPRAHAETVIRIPNPAHSAGKSILMTKRGSVERAIGGGVRRPEHRARRGARDAGEGRHHDGDAEARTRSTDARREERERAVHADNRRDRPR